MMMHLILFAWSGGGSGRDETVRRPLLTKIFYFYFHFFTLRYIVDRNFFAAQEGLLDMSCCLWLTKGAAIAMLDCRIIAKLGRAALRCRVRKNGNFQGRARWKGPIIFS